ncbi:hypothetical protein OIDMADRAFT_47319 [Oidiodendron maius Zn]|uniref:Uncharacterized protein n=1 Tax=Oidiodendron maius (strain Zn) TaxID=913774 RepID=A0A0C3HGT1_OIDMZ|nr:hypothetical protein OIDMADRAFT_47319 [Oidiodendron maius Zn]
MSTIQPTDGMDVEVQVSWADEMNAIAEATANPQAKSLPRRPRGENEAEAKEEAASAEGPEAQRASQAPEPTAAPQNQGSEDRSTQGQGRALKPICPTPIVTDATTGIVAVAIPTTGAVTTTGVITTTGEIATTSEAEVELPNKSSPSPSPTQQPPELLLKVYKGRGRGPRLQGAGEIIANALIGKRPCLILQPMLHVPTGA